MPTYNRLTDRTLATGVTLTDFIHIVITGDTSQNAAGSSYKATIAQLAAVISGGTSGSGTSGTNGTSGTDGTSGVGTNGTSGTDGTNGTSGTSGGGTGDYLPLSGGTVTGNTYFGVTSGITIDQSNSRIGINTTNPQNTLELYDSNSLMIYGESSGGYVQISGNTGLPRFQTTSGPSGLEPSYSLQMGVRNYNNISNPGYGATGDTFLYASNEANGLNIINRQTSTPGTKEDYIRFYAGQDADGTIPDIHIAGTGATRGYVGFGTQTPTEKVDVDGNVKMSGELTIGTVGVTSPLYLLGIDSNGLVVSGSTGTSGGEYLSLSGGTVTGTTFFTEGMSAVTFSAVTIGSSGECVTDLYVTNIHSCSPLNINPFNEGNVIFGQSNQMVLDLANKRVGFNKVPLFPLDLDSNYGTFSYKAVSTYNALQLSGSSNQYSLSTLVAGNNTITISVNGENYENDGLLSGDTYILSSQNTNNFQIILPSGGTGTKDVKFKVGSQPTNSSDLIIKGSGSTRGYVGIGTESPDSPLHVSGNTKISGTLTASTLNISSTPTTDTNVPINFLTRDSSTGEVKVKTIPGPTVYGLFSQTGNSIVISATTTETTLIDGGVGTLSVPANGFNIGDSFRGIMGGVINAGNNEDIQLRVKSGSVVLADSLMQNLIGSTNDIWTLQLDFTIRATGTTGVASIVTLGVFNVHKTSNNTSTGFSFNSVNNTTFDTTNSNTLDITVEWDTTSSSNSIYTDIFVLNKIY